MDFETLAKTMARSFFIITTGIVVGNYIFCLIFSPDAVLPLRHFGRLLLCALLSDIPYILFYSKKELSKKQMTVRKIMHGIALLAVLLTIAYLWGWIDFNNPLETAIYLLIIAIVYIAVYTSSYISDKKLAEKLNESLKKHYQK